MLQIAVFFPDNQQSASAISKHEPTVNPFPYLKPNHYQSFYLRKNDVHNIDITGIDVVLNLCDGAADDDRPGIEVVQYLEKHKIPFTGANSFFYEPTRQVMKAAAINCGIQTPKAMYVHSLQDLKHFSLRFPCIVKHFNSYSSIGLSKKSVVSNIEDLSEQTNAMLTLYGAALIEEYIEGREFTVLVVSIDNQKAMAYDAAEIIFPEDETFKHFELKWLQHTKMKYIKVTDNRLNETLKNASIKIYKHLKGNGYARFDYRMNAKGELYFLELNPNCSVYYPSDNPSSADEILFFSENGHQLFTQTILTFAMQRFD